MPIHAKNYVFIKRDLKYLQDSGYKYFSLGASRVEELEDAKRKLAARVQEMEEALSAAESKAASMEKVKNRMNEEVEDLLLDLEKVSFIFISLQTRLVI